MNKLFFVVSSILVALALYGCSDDISIEEQENYIKYTVYCEDKDAQLHITATGHDYRGIYTKNDYTNELNTKDFFAIIDVKCDNPKALIYIDLTIGKRKLKTHGNSPIHVSERIKGEGPFLY